MILIVNVDNRSITLKCTRSQQRSRGIGREGRQSQGRTRTNPPTHPPTHIHVPALAPRCSGDELAELRRFAARVGQAAQDGYDGKGRPALASSDRHGAGWRGNGGRLPAATADGQASRASERAPSLPPSSAGGGGFWTYDEGGPVLKVR